MIDMSIAELLGDHIEAEDVVHPETDDDFRERIVATIQKSGTVWSLPPTDFESVLWGIGTDLDQIGAKHGITRKGAVTT